MSKIIILMSGTVFIINFIYMLLPKGEYEKYCKFVLGLVFMLVFVGSFVGVEISSEVLDPALMVPSFNDEKIKSVVRNQTQKMVEDKIEKHLESNKITAVNVRVQIVENEIAQILVISNDSAEKISMLISDFCDIDKEKIFVEQVE